MNTVNAIDSTEINENSDFIRSCRLCFSNNTIMSNIFDNNNKIVEKIEFCTGILIKQQVGISTLICVTCIKNLSISHEFKTSCLLSEQILSRIIHRIKIEQSDETKDENYHYNYNNEIKDETQWESCDTNNIRTDNINNDLRRSKRKVKEKSDLINIKKRGPYKKHTRIINSKCDKMTKKGTRIKKYKFKKLFCEVCNIKFTNKQDSDAHKKEHTDGVKFVCEFCGKEFIRYSSLYSHLRSHLPPHFECAHCDYSCTTKHDLTKHLRIHFGIKNYKCMKCNATFHTTSNLRDHERRQHTGVTKRHACYMCEKTFYDKTKLNRHIDSHSHIKRFSCEHCRSSFTRRCYWKKHLQKQHNITVPPQRPGRQSLYVALNHKNM